MRRCRGAFQGEPDPDQPLNGEIVNIDKAPRNARGLIEYAADFYILKPVDITKGNGALLYDVNNRGNKRALVQFKESALTTVVPRTTAPASQVPRRSARLAPSPGGAYYGGGPYYGPGAVAIGTAGAFAAGPFHYGGLTYYDGSAYYGGWDAWARIAGIKCRPGTLVKLDDGLMHVCQ